MWLYRPNAIQCLTSIRVSASRHSYGKTAATVWTSFNVWQALGFLPQNIVMRRRLQPSGRCDPHPDDVVPVRTMCDPVRTMSSIRQVVHTKFNCPNVSLHGPDDQASYMEIACTSSTVRTLAFRVWTLKALIWKLRAAKVKLSGP
jgi:hypothetical protein